MDYDSLYFDSSSPKKKSNSAASPTHRAGKASLANDDDDPFANFNALLAQFSSNGSNGGGGVGSSSSNSRSDALEQSSFHHHGDGKQRNPTRQPTVVAEHPDLSVTLSRDVVRDAPIDGPPPPPTRVPTSRSGGGGAASSHQQHHSTSAHSVSSPLSPSPSSGVFESSVNVSSSSAAGLHKSSSTTVHHHAPPPAVEQTPAPVRLSKEGIASAAYNYTRPPLGKGGFSVVHEGKFYGKPAAVKVLAIRNDHERKMFDEELRAMLNPSLRHANVCPLLAYCSDSPSFIFPRLTAMNVERMTRLPDDVKDSICIDVANGLWHLHKAGFVHMDMKPDNVLILFDENRRIQKALVGDLGCVKSTAHPVLPYGTIVFLDPQLRFDAYRNPHPADDVYSLGITYLSIWTNRVPHVRDEIPHLLAVLRHADRFRYTLVKAMINPELMQRPTLGYVRDVMKARQRHLWSIKGYPWSGKVPLIIKAPFIGEHAAQEAAKNGFPYSPPAAVPPQFVTTAAATPSNMIPKALDAAVSSSEAAGGIHHSRGVSGGAASGGAAVSGGGGGAPHHARVLSSGASPSAYAPNYMNNPLNLNASMMNTSMNASMNMSVNGGAGGPPKLTAEEQRALSERRELMKANEEFRAQRAQMATDAGSPTRGGQQSLAASLNPGSGSPVHHHLHASHHQRTMSGQSPSTYGGGPSDAQRQMSAAQMGSTLATAMPKIQSYEASRGGQANAQQEEALRQQALGAMFFRPQEPMHDYLRHQQQQQDAMAKSGRR